MLNSHAVKCHIVSPEATQTTQGVTNRSPEYVTPGYMNAKLYFLMKATFLSDLLYTYQCIQLLCFWNKFLFGKIIKIPSTKQREIHPTDNSKGVIDAGSQTPSNRVLLFPVGVGCNDLWCFDFHSSPKKCVGENCLFSLQIEYLYFKTPRNHALEAKVPIVNILGQHPSSLVGGFMIWATCKLSTHMHRVKAICRRKFWIAHGLGQSKSWFSALTINTNAGELCHPMSPSRMSNHHHIIIQILTHHSRYQPSRWYFHLSILQANLLIVGLVRRCFLPF